MPHSGFDILLHGNWELPGTGDTLDDDVGFLHTAFEKLGLGTGQQRLNNAVVPASSHDSDTEPTSIVVLWCRSFVMHVDGGRKVL